MERKGSTGETEGGQEEGFFLIVHAGFDLAEGVTRTGSHPGGIGHDQVVLGHAGLLVSLLPALLRLGVEVHQVHLDTLEGLAMAEQLGVDLALQHTFQMTIQSEHLASLSHPL